MKVDRLQELAGMGSLYENTTYGRLLLPEQIKKLAEDVFKAAERHAMDVAEEEGKHAVTGDDIHAVAASVLKVVSRKCLEQVEHLIKKEYT